MPQRSLALLAFAFGLLLVLPASVLAQATDPESVIRGYYAAVNAHDLDAAVAFLADDVVYKVQPPPPNTSGVATGKPQGRAFVQSQLADNIHVDLGNVQVQVDTVTYAAMITTDPLQKAGIAPIEYQVTAIVQGGKIKSFTSVATQATLAKLQAGAAKTLPQTGGGGLAFVQLLLRGALGLMFVVCVACGLLVLRRRPA